MSQHIDDNNDGTTTSRGFPAHFHIVPIERGPDRKKWKAPTHKGWNQDHAVYRYDNQMREGFNGGLCHKSSGTCAIDIDNLRQSHILFADHGLRLNELLMTGCQISSGRDNRSKLLYRLPSNLIVDNQFPRTKQIAGPDGMIVEFRCVYGTGLTCQDVLPGSIHPDTDQPYVTIGDLHNLPEIPEDLLAWWLSLMTPRTADQAAWSGVPDTQDERNKIKRALRVISADITYPEWRNVGVAIHDTGWPDAFDLWDDWSAGGMDYDYDGCVDKWNDMTPGAGINLFWLYHKANEQKGDWDRPRLEDMFQPLNQATAAGATMVPVAGDPVTIENDTQEVATDLHAIISQVTAESDATVMEWACQHIALSGGNRAQQFDWVHILADRSRYNLSVLGPMLSQARREMALVREVEGEVIEFIHVNESGNPLATKANAQAVADHYGYQFKYNLMTRAIEENNRYMDSVASDAAALAKLSYFKDHCVMHRLDSKFVQEHRDLMGFENAYHPFIQYLEQEALLHGAYRRMPTIGALEEDWIDRLSGSLILEDPSKKALSKTLLTRWLVSAVAAAHLRDESDYDPWETPPKAPRGVLVLQGDQNMGKTSWFRDITPRGMYKEGLQINLNDMNHMKTATNRLIVEIGEAEHATKGRMANYMKTIIGRDVDEVRLAFQREELRMVRRSVFCATVNPASFLGDEQNTRWWSIQLKSIDFDILGSVDIKRLWQQVYDLWLKGYEYHLTRPEMAELNNHNETFRDTCHFENWLLDSYDFEDMAGADDRDNWKTTSEIRARYSANDMPNFRVMKSILERLTKHKSSLCRKEDAVGRYWKLPALKGE